MDLENGTCHLMSSGQGRLPRDFKEAVRTDSLNL